MKSLFFLPLSLCLLATPASAEIVRASWYKSGHTTANGEHYYPHRISAAHKKLKFGTKVRVTNLRTGLSVVVRINDRGPYITGRTIDLSLGAARVIGMVHQGVARVKMEILSTPRKRKT